ncbi:hypothetical protein ACHAXA_011550 [Cyclostephanos tholiformis]|uniref:HTH TFE/IIEalpha-type domain-containing protein n=1 Tax=Cyclostephanos tholiformis TaxID=382380 RepID=A0ABD3R4L6_9STRA
MSVRLGLPSKQLRRTLQFMENERLVKNELVDDLNTGGSQNTKFWYIDYNHAVHVIRLRIHLLQRRLQEAEMRARSSSLYLCPGYKSRMCNGRYNEGEAQVVVDNDTGLFLCRECVRTYANHPHPPDRVEYTLQLIDNRDEVNRAIEDMRRVRVQLSAKVDVNGTTLRQGIFDLLQRVKSSSTGGINEPLTANLPSENIAMGIGSKRIAGTGRTAGLLIKKKQRQGILTSADGDVVVGIDRGNIDSARRRGLGGGGGDRVNVDELTFLKNAMGQEIAFDLERGGGARANLLATRGRIRDKLIDAAAMRVGMDLGLVTRVILDERDRRMRRRREEEEKEQMMGGRGSTRKRRKNKKHALGEELHFLRDNLGFANTANASGVEGEMRRDESSDVVDDDHVGKESYYVPDETDEFRNLPEDERRAEWLYWYARCVQSQQAAMERAEDMENVAWEDG